MLRRLVLSAVSLGVVLSVAWAADNERATLLIPGVQCPMCVDRLTNSLRTAGATVEGLTPESKTAIVAYDPSKLTVHQLVQKVAETAPVHNKPYQAGLLINVDDLAKNGSKLQATLRRVKGVAGVQAAPGGAPGEVVITFVPLGPQAKAGDTVKASQIAEALDKANIRFSGLDAETARGAGGLEERKQPATRGFGKTKPGDGLSDEKGKPARPFGGGTTKERARPIAPAASAARPRAPAAKPKSAAPDPDAPRFQIQALAGEKPYLVDHEANLKKFVKAGDAFGDYVVQSIGTDDDGFFVLLENPATKETVRVDKDPKDKEKSADDSKPEKGGTDRPAGSTAKPAGSSAQDPSRFQIQAAAAEGVYLVDHETKIKKFVKVGDKFGDFVVKEISDKDGRVVVLEDPETKKTIRIEDKKDKEKEREKQAE